MTISVVQTLFLAQEPKVPIIVLIPRKRGESVATGTLVVTFFNTHLGSPAYVGEYHFVLLRACDPHTILHSFRGKLSYQETKTFVIGGLQPGNYLLTGLKLPDPKPGNRRTHQIMIYAGLETVYDVCYQKNAMLTIE